MQTLRTVLYRGGAESDEPRVGRVRAHDGVFDLPYIPPVPGPWDGQVGTNPEQLLAAAWAICFHGVLALVLRTRGVEASGYRVRVDVDLGQDADGALGLGADVTVDGLDLDAELRQAVLREAFQRCPFCRAMHDNIRVDLR
ncbi:OsmC family protein [Saccharothrix sp. S26]|uniref:OsmC family protein n=1 Tax=Saccharothrix sp. S26 TaxID=2907215 RepID=UPI001F21FE90|nr:OsmC family protein [Saccharothrix sp. S26]MCE6996332.1 OsmC family protein [Saccharothrix sp. S26]